LAASPRSSARDGGARALKLTGKALQLPTEQSLQLLLTHALSLLVHRDNAPAEAWLT